MDNNKPKTKKKWWIPFIIILLLAVVAAAVIGVIFVRPDKNMEETEEITYIDPQNLQMYGYEGPGYLPEDDEDKDGLINEEEEQLGTNVFVVDSDKDGLTDFEEHTKTNTDPLCADSDRDGLDDGIELMAELDPNNKKTGDVNDADQSFEVEYAIDNMTLNVSGNANIYGITAEVADITGLNQTPGVIGNVYEFYTDKRFDSATISISYDNNELEEMGIGSENLAICQFTDEGKFVQVNSSIVDETAGMVTAELEHFSRYALCNTGAIYEDATPQVMLLVDNSGSMYPKELMETSDENDVDFKRVDMAKNLIEMSDEKIEFGLAKFTADYTEMAEMGADRDEIIEQLESIKTTEENFNGTYLETSLIKALDVYEETDQEHRKFIVLLTDGESTEGMGLFSFKNYDKDDIISKAKKKNTTIITIGLGNSVDRDFLSEVAEKTGGVYIHASNADALETVYEVIMAALEYNFADLDKDGINESILMADSGFSATRDILKYENYYLLGPDGYDSGGQCYGISALEQLYYIGELPLTMEESDSYGYGFLGLSGSLQGAAYDLTDTFFTKLSGEDYVLTNTRLNNYQNETLRIYDEIMGVDVEKRYENNDGYLTLKEKYQKQIEANPFLKTKKVECGKAVYGDWEYSAYDQWYIDIYNVDIEDLTAEEQEEYEVLCMIYRLFVVQLSPETETFSIDTTSLSGNAQEKNMDKLLDMVGSGTPALISAKNHTVLCTKIYRDLENPNQYTLAISDSNVPRETRFLTIEREKSGFALDVTAWTNDYLYTAYDESGIFGDKGESISIEVDDISAFYEE